MGGGESHTHSSLESPALLPRYHGLLDLGDMTDGRNSENFPLAAYSEYVAKCCEAATLAFDEFPHPQKQSSSKRSGRRGLQNGGRKPRSPRGISGGGRGKNYRDDAPSRSLADDVSEERKSTRDWDREPGELRGVPMSAGVATGVRAEEDPSSVEMFNNFASADRQPGPGFLGPDRRRQLACV